MGNFPELNFLISRASPILRGEFILPKFGTQGIGGNLKLRLDIRISKVEIQYNC